MSALALALLMNVAPALSAIAVDNHAAESQPVVMLAQAAAIPKRKAVRRAPAPAAATPANGKPASGGSAAPEGAGSSPDAMSSADGAEQAAAPEAEAYAPKTDPGVSQVLFDRSEFRPDPAYKDLAYNADAQYQVYGGKHRLSDPRPLLELGYPMYLEGDFGPGTPLFGQKNLVRPQFLLYGDWQAAAALNNNGKPDVHGNKEVGLFATRLNLDADLKLTGTERIHILLRPLDHGGKFTSYQFEGVGANGKPVRKVRLNGNLVTGFFEGDLGAIAQGITGNYNHLDMPIAVGLIPLLFQNGVWMDDAILGAAVTIPAMNSALLDIANFDITIFGGVDNVDTPAFKATDKGQVLGVASFFETHQGYVEAGYGYVRDQNNPDLNYHSITAAYSRRYGGWLSNSVRVIGSVGQKGPAAGAKTANGGALLLENSLITKKPYTLLPYFNLFVTSGTPQSLARDPGAGGLLKNTGINFETDGLTGFPKIDDAGRDSYGGAVGLEYLFDLDQQIVAEIATSQHIGGPLDGTADYAFGLRWQKPFWDRWIIRADGMVGRGNLAGTPNEKLNLSGIRLDLRVKF